MVFLYWWILIGFFILYFDTVKFIKYGYPYLLKNLGIFISLATLFEKTNKPFSGSVIFQFPVTAFINKEAKALPKNLIFGILPCIPSGQNLSHFIKSEEFSFASY